MKALGRVAVIGWVIGAAVIIYAVIVGPAWLVIGVFVLWAPAAVWQLLRMDLGLSRVMKDEWYTPVEKPETFADAINNLNGALGNLARSISGRTPPDDHDTPSE